MLEVGIGTGASLPYYRPGVTLSGIDLSPGMLAVARRHAVPLGMVADLQVMNAERMDFPDHAFDCVIFSLCLCTVPHPERAITEGLRVVKPAGRLVFLEHVRSNLPPVAALQWLLSLATVPLQQDHWDRRTPELVRECGVTVVSERRWLLGMFDLLIGEA